MFLEEGRAFEVTLDCGFIVVGVVALWEVDPPANNSSVMGTGFPILGRSSLGELTVSRDKIIKILNQTRIPFVRNRIGHIFGYLDDPMLDDSSLCPHIIQLSCNHSSLAIDTLHVMNTI
jgi:hypothetical protein